MTKMRLDHRMIQLGLASARQKAVDYIKSGNVVVNGQPASRPAQRVLDDDQIFVMKPDVYVSRGAHKLAFGLSHFDISVEGKICLDVGASTGGFTQVCLGNGASKVYAIDVGRDQLHASLRNDPRVISLEQTNVKDLALPEQVHFVCVDVSFISLKLVLPLLAKFLAKDTDLVILIKPQYEVGKDNLPADGIVVDPEKHRQVVEEVLSFATATGFHARGSCPSPISGKGGNSEFLAHLRF